MTQFKAGDRIRAVRDIDNCYPSTGKVGTVIDVFHDLPDDICHDIAIEFIEHIGGHSCGERCHDGHGLYAYTSDVELIEKA